LLMGSPSSGQLPVELMDQSWDTQLGLIWVSAGRPLELRVPFPDRNGPAGELPQDRALRRSPVQRACRARGARCGPRSSRPSVLTGCLRIVTECRSRHRVPVWQLQTACLTAGWGFRKAVGVLTVASEEEPADAHSAPRSPLQRPRCSARGLGVGPAAPRGGRPVPGSPCVRMAGCTSPRRPRWFWTTSCTSRSSTAASSTRTTHCEATIPEAPTFRRCPRQRLRLRQRPSPTASPASRSPTARRRGHSDHRE
jgi:hypothetical protein